MDRMTWARAHWDRLTAGAATGAGAVVLLIGWYGVSGSPYTAGQLPYLISAGIGGLFLLGIGTALWLSADLHDEWRKLDRIEQAIRAAEDRAAALETRPRPKGGISRQRVNGVPAGTPADAR